MKLLLVTPYYWPESFGAGVNMTELAEGLAELGHQVTVVTQMPNYPDGIIHPDYGGKDRMEEVRNRVTILRGRAQTASRTDSVIKKGRAAWDFGRTAARLLRSVQPEPDIVMTVTPPPFCGRAAANFARRAGKPLFVRVADITARALAVAGVNPGLATKFVTALEMKLLRSAQAINLVTDAYREFVEAQPGITGQVSVVYDWADGEVIRPEPRESPLREQWGLGGKRVVMYSGSLGYTSDLETAIEGFALLKNSPEFHLLIVGQGAKLEALTRRVAELGLPNVSFRPLVPREQLSQSLAVGDVHLVTLTPEGAKSSTQGKLKSILAAGRGVIGVMPKGCSEAKLIENLGVGAVVENGDASGLAALIRELNFDDAAGATSEHARETFERHYERVSAVKSIETILHQLNPRR